MKWKFTINGKDFFFKTLKEARYCASFNKGLTIIHKVTKK